MRAETINTSVGFLKNHFVFDESSPHVPGDESIQIPGSFSPSPCSAFPRQEPRAKGESERLNEEDLVFGRRQDL